MEDRYKYSLLEAVTTLVGHITGTVSGLQQKELEELYKWVQQRESEWEPTTDPKKHYYDIAVRTLVYRALWTYNEYKS